MAESLTFDAGLLARGWLSVAIATGKDEGRPALDRTVSIEAFASGVRLTATDSYVLLRVWVPTLENEWEGAEPDLDEAPAETSVAVDPHGRGKGFLAYALKLAKEAAKAEAIDPPEVRLTLNVEGDAETEGTFDGMEPSYVVLELPDETLRLETYEGDYPQWRNAIGNYKRESTSALALSPEIIGRLSKLGTVHPGPLLWHFGGERGMARLAMPEADPVVFGVVMPVRWDFDTNEPRVDVERSAAGTEDDA